MEDSGLRAGYGGLTVSVRLISPAQDLADFPDLADLPVSTTVGQIKLLIGNELAFRNRSPAGMRVIFRGRLLDMDEKTLAEVFGIPTIQETRLQVLHLVLRDGSAGTNAGAARAPNQQQLRNPFAPRTVPEQPTAPSVPAGFEQLPPHGHYASPPHGLPPQPFPRQAIYQHQLEQYFAHPPHYNQYVPTQHDQAYTIPQQARQAPDQSSGVSLVQDLQQQLQSRGRRLEEWEMQQLMLLQQSRIREQQTEHQQRQQRQDRPQEQEEPHTVESSGQQETREHAHPTETMPNLSQRLRAAPMPPQETDSQEPPETATTTGASRGFPHYTVRPNIYILESPSGPRAVLVGGSFQESVPIPQVAAARQENHHLYMDLIQQHNLQIQQQRQSYENLLRQNMQNVEMLQRLQQLHLQRNQMHEQHSAAQQRAAQEQADPAAGAGQQPQVPNLHVNHHHGPGMQPNNPGAGFLAAMWPHVWLVIRLVLFIWWFTNPSASWTRWIMVILIATAVFVYNTGVLDGFADQIWAPIRAHLDGLVNVPNANGGAGQAGAQNAGQNAAGPAGDANGAANGANGANGDPTAAEPVGRAGGPEPDPAQVAARLVAQRRNNNGQRLQEFARRLERIGIMFLASLAPGIAERHVALAEEREREERRRVQEAVEAAIAAAAEAQAQAEAAAAAAAATAGEGTKTAAADEVEAGPGAPEEQPNLDDDIAAVDAQWQSEQQRQNDRNAAAGVS